MEGELDPGKGILRYFGKIILDKKFHELQDVN